jgi:hypothetical protein
MKKIIFLVLIFLISSTNILSQNIELLEVKGIKIGTSYSDVLEKLGKPKSVVEGGEFPCDSGKFWTVRYSGLIFKILEGNEGNEKFVAEVNVESDKWSVSGIKIGESIEGVKAKFGESELMKEEDFDMLGYINGDGYSYFYFKDNKLVKIIWELNTC